MPNFYQERQCKVVTKSLKRETDQLVKLTKLQNEKHALQINEIPFDFNNIFLNALVSPAKLLLFYLIINKGSSIVISSTNGFMILSEIKFNFETHLQYDSQVVL